MLVIKRHSKYNGFRDDRGAIKITGLTSYKTSKKAVKRPQFQWSKRAHTTSMSKAMQAKGGSSPGFLSLLTNFIRTTVAKVFFISLTAKASLNYTAPDRH